MNPERSHFIKFKNCDLRQLRNGVLEDLSREHFSVLLGKAEQKDGYTFLNVFDIHFPQSSDYNSQSLGSINLRGEYIYRILAELMDPERYDIDTIIDVHTHPFCRDHVSFSSIDDNDEKTFFQFLIDKFDGLHYGSIVFSQTEYSARIWTRKEDIVISKYALIKTQTQPENIDSSDFSSNDKEHEGNTLTETNNIFNRGVLALGLDIMRHIVKDQIISVIGIGGLGSVISEHLIHMGFHHINLIDPDILEISNLNRFVGAYYEDAKRNSYKVDTVKRHLDQINPHAEVFAYRNDIHDEEMEKVIALSDWMIVGTDNHSSRFKSQQLSVKYFVPLIAAGVNITVEDGEILDMSGEVVTARVGDNLCLNCLKRIDPIKIAADKHPDQNIQDLLVTKGYVSGRDIKEPAVKTLNTFIATMAVDILINQYTEYQDHVPILVYENNRSKMIYEDLDSVRLRNKNCFTCNI